MATRLDITLGVLAETRNEAATDALRDALASPHAAVQEGALRSLAERRSLPAQRELLARWHTLPDAWKTIVAEKPGRLASALRDALLGDDENLLASACDAVLALREYDLMPALIKAATRPASPAADAAAATLLRLAQRLYDEVAAGITVPGRRDPQLFRVQVVAALDLTVQRYADHGRMEVIEAFLLLARSDNATLKRILRQPLDRSHQPIIQCLTHSPRPAIMRLLLAFLDDGRAPSAALGAVSRRSDEPFVSALLRHLSQEISAGAKTNLRQMTRLAWLEHDIDHLAHWDEAAQYAAVQAAALSGIGHDAALAVLGCLARQGQPAARLAAVEALQAIPGAAAQPLVLEALDDDDPHVQAAALAQLRQRGMPSAMHTLIDALDSPQEVIRSAARGSLGEFNFARYLGAFDALDDDVRRHTGQLVRKVDLNSPAALAEELAAPARSRRLRAIAIAETMQLAAAVEEPLLGLLEDDDHMIRAAAAAALADVPGERTRSALREALLDSSIAVQNAAEQSLEALASTRSPRPLMIDLGAIRLPEAGLSLAGH